MSRGLHLSKLHYGLISHRKLALQRSSAQINGEIVVRGVNIKISQKQVILFYFLPIEGRQADTLNVMTPSADKIHESPISST